MWNKLKQAEWVKWAPETDLMVALLTEAWMIVACYTMTHTTSFALMLFGFVLLTNVVMNVLLPIYWVVGYRKQPFSELGITTRHWLPSLILSLLVAGSTWRRAWPLLAGRDWLPHVLCCLTRNLLVLWPPAWGMAGSMGTAQGGFFFDWTMISIAVVVLAIQLGFIGYMGWQRARAEAGSEAV